MLNVLSDYPKEKKKLIKKITELVSEGHLMNKKKGTKKKKKQKPFRMKVISKNEGWYETIYEGITETCWNRSKKKIGYII